MIYKIFAEKDTFITNIRVNGVQRTGSNFGECEILHLFKRVETNLTSSIARILTKFDLSVLQDLVVDGYAPASNKKFYLKLHDADHDKTLPSSFDVEVQSVTQQWDEGRGFDVDSFADKGFANWVNARTAVQWTTPGASGSGPISVESFDNGHENMEVDVTPIVDQWLSGSTNNGFLVKLSSSLELDNNNYYIKMFHGKQTFFKDRRPCLEVRWDDSIKDDRNNFFFDVSGTLTLKNKIRGQFTDIPSIGTGSVGVKIVNGSSVLSVLTGSHAGTPGVYTVDFAIASASYSGSVFNDVWFNLSSPTTAYLTGSFSMKETQISTSNYPKRYFVSIPNLKNSYSLDELARLNLFVRPHDYNVARVLTASLEPRGEVITKGYYKIVNDRTDEVVIGFGTGSLETTRLSYDENGNYFNLHMGSLSSGNIYRLSFLFDVDGQRQYITDAGLKFRVI